MKISNKTIVHVFVFLFFVSYPYYFIESFHGSFNRRELDLANILFSKALKDIWLAFALVYLCRLRILCQRHVVLMLVTFGLMFVPPMVVTCFVDNALARIILGLRSIAYFVVPVLIGMSFRTFGVNTKYVRLLFFVSLLGSIVHTVAVHMGAAQIVYKTSGGEFYRSYGFQAEPNLMAFVFALAAISLFESRRPWLGICALGVSLSSFSVTGFVPIGLYGLFLMSFKYRMVIGSMLAIVFPYTALFRLRGILGYTDTSDWSYLGKLRAYANTFELFGESDWVYRLFGHGLAINDASGAYLSKLGVNPLYFSAESTYNMFLTQFGLISLFIFVGLFVVSSFVLILETERLAKITVIVNMAIFIASFWLLYFSLMQVIVIYGFIIGLAFNPYRRDILKDVRKHMVGQLLAHRRVRGKRITQPIGLTESCQ